MEVEGSFFIYFYFYFLFLALRGRARGSFRPKKPPRLPDKEELRVLRAVVGEVDAARRLDKQVQLCVYEAFSY